MPLADSCTQANLFMLTNSAARALLSLCYRNAFEFCASVFLPCSFFFPFHIVTIRNSPLILCLIGLTFLRAMRHSQWLEENW